MLRKLFSLLLVLVMFALPVMAMAEESDLHYVKGKGNLIIGYTVFQPMNYTDADGTFTGFDTELALAVCELLGLKPEFVEINWDTKEIELAARTIDCVWNGLTITEDRKQNMEITNPYVKNAQVVVMKAGAAYENTASLAGKTVVAETGSAGETLVLSDAGLMLAEYITKGKQTDCLMEVAAGTADAAVLDLTLANAMVGEGTDYAGLVIVGELEAEFLRRGLPQGFRTSPRKSTRPSGRSENRGLWPRWLRTRADPALTSSAAPDRGQACLSPVPYRSASHGRISVILRRLLDGFQLNLQLFILTLLFRASPWPP